VSCLPEGAVAYISGFDVDGVTAGNDGGNGSDRRGLALHHLGIDNHDDGVLCVSVIQCSLKIQFEMVVEREEEKAAMKER
jgi:hypothetical protein